jgi:hypothetical protein
VCHSARVLLCDECGCRSKSGKGWLAYLAQDPEEDEWPETVVYCPPCAARELGALPRLTAYC